MVIKIYFRKDVIPTERFPNFEGEPKHLSPLVLAFIGDGVFELLVRGNIINEKGNMPAKKLHRHAVNQVNATAQAEFYDLIIESLTEEESDILRRGRNANVSRVPKNASVEDYHKATAVEALFGYLYLCGDINRIISLFSISMHKEDIYEKSV